MENAIIPGDFNMHIEETTDNNSKIFIDTMEALGLWHHVNEPLTKEERYETSFSLKSQPK